MATNSIAFREPNSMAENGTNSPDIRTHIWSAGAKTPHPVNGPGRKVGLKRKSLNDNTHMHVTSVHCNMQHINIQTMCVVEIICLFSACSPANVSVSNMCELRVLLIHAAWHSTTKKNMTNKWMRHVHMHTYAYTYARKCMPGLREIAFQAPQD